MKNKELIKELSKQPEDAHIWIPVWNGHVETYGVVDYVHAHEYSMWANDFFGTPGRMDKRLFSGIPDDAPVICLSSRFGSIPDSTVDIGDDDIDYPIKTINGKDGDPDLVWHLSAFEESEENGKRMFIKRFSTDGKESGFVAYYPDEDRLVIENDALDIRFSGKIAGIESLRNVIEACKAPVKIIA